MSDALDVILTLAVWWLSLVVVTSLAGGAVWAWQILVRDHVARGLAESEVPRVWTADET